MSWLRREGSPLPLGVTWVPADAAYNFALYSKHAERVVLHFFGEQDLVRPALSVDFDYRHHKSGRVWHCRLGASELRGGRYYAYSVSGPPPESRVAWHAFDPGKLLLDPYADSVFFPPSFDRRAAIGRGSNAGRAALGILPPPVPDESPPRARALSPHEADAVIYELHVRNFTRHPDSGVSAGNRGTFAGIVEKIPYLVDLGVTIVELMPVFQYDPAARDRWGYMPMSFFALHDGYLSAPDPAAGHREFRNMVDALHGAGIEVVLDVVFNHTCEGDHDGPVYGLKGIDNSTYYLMTGDPARPYADYSGTGNTINCANAAVRKMILDSMRHWVRLGVDGFRFDLASVYARDANGVLRYEEAPVFGDIVADPEFAGIRLIAEPWDAGAYQLGRGFPGFTWHQWNAAFRDDVRRFVRGDSSMVASLMRRLYGSDDLFPDDRIHAYLPRQSVNYVTSHDGPTLYDLVSHDRKHNWANGHGNADGPSESFGWNCGWEGDEGLPPAVEELRLRQARNFVALLFLANGTPMLRAGDEFLHTQGGNDNPYNQDDETTWLDWSRTRRFSGMLRFVRMAIAFRKEHPSLCRSRFWRGDVRWYGSSGPVDLSPGSRHLAFCLHGAAEADEDVYVMVNAGANPEAFHVLEGTDGEWLKIVDTSMPSPDDFSERGGATRVAALDVPVGPRSVVVLTRAKK